MARPTDFTPEKADYIIDKLTQGIPLAEICREDDMPSTTTVRAWAKKDPDGFGVSYAHAREDGEELLAISQRRVANGDTGYSTGDVARDKLKIETDFRLLKVFNPKKYGDKLQQELTGPDGGKIEIETKGDTELNARILELAAKVGAIGAAGAAGREEE